MENELKRKWKVILIHHTHLDIGYTHTQDEVLLLQIKHLKKAMDLIEKNKHRPEGNRFKWNPEITWALIEWIKIAPQEELDKFIQYVQEGYIGLDGLYGNILTGLCRPEELMDSFIFKKQLEQLTKTDINSAMITDIPGWNWGFVTTLKENGIRYLSIGTNLSDRIGHVLRDWKDKPFYWESPSGERVLTFVHGKGYSWFHTGLKSSKNLSRKLKPSRVEKYLKTLENNNYPHDTIILRYNIGQDNGPPDENICDIIERWNVENPNMTLSLSTTKEAMEYFEKEYGHKIPVFKGDITPYWEDGACSTSRETALTRRNSEKLEQLNILSTMTKTKFNFEDALKHILLYNEHTWGAYNSISKPDHPFAKSQWAWKRSHATEAEMILNCHTNNIMSKYDFDRNFVTVYNTHSWDISQIVTINTHHNAVYDANNKKVPSQKLKDGQMAFIAKDVKGFSSSVYTLKSEKKSNIQVKASFKSKIKLNSQGLIESIIYDEKEFVKQSDIEKFNHFIFATGKWGKKQITHLTTSPTITVVEDGHIIKKYEVSYNAYRDTKITSTITINSLNPVIHIENTLDRSPSRKKEGLHFQFPLDLPNGRIKYDVIYGSAVVDKDQLKGSNKNFITTTRWFDVSNNDYGMSIATLDAPIFKPNKIVPDPFRSGNPNLCGWLTSTPYTGNVYSYVMNNYWMTNYKADQPGITSFSYAFMPHKQFNESKTVKFSLEEAQPLIVGFHSNKIDSLLHINNENVICTKLHNCEKNYVARFWNMANETEKIKLPFTSLKVLSPNKSSSLEENTLTIKPKETILISFKLN